MNFLGSLIGLGGAAAGSIPSLLRSGVENRMRAMAAGRGPSAAQTMLQQQGAANARNALSVASAQPGGLGLLQGLRSMEEMNRTAGQQAANARVQEQMQAIGAAKQAEDARHQALYRLGAGVAGMGSAFDAQQTAAQQADLAHQREMEKLRLEQAGRERATDAARQTQVQNQVAATPLPTTQLTEPTLGQPQDPNALPAWMQSIRLR